MRPIPEPLICSLGHVATTAEFARRGYEARDIRLAIQAGVIRRASRGVYLCRHADADQLTAAAAHARITCLSALRRAGVWAGLDQSLHLQLPPNSHSARRPVRDRDDRSIHYHWAPVKFDRAPRKSWLVDPIEAVWQAIHCLDEEHAVACLESAVHEKFLTEQEVRRIGANAPRHLQRGIREMEFTSDSGQETIARRRLRRIGFHVVAQEKISGLPYSEDLVVDDCVALETDGKKWHGPERFEPDRQRDVVLAGFGRVSLRLTQRMILHEWPSTLAAIERAVRDAKRTR
ncbi:hypothetical protein GCM10022381_18700 [Leifsonia kafniensis]|uniref:DUF559 domain-containing protein n=1 Tax=Leifsonia kafniensis TaxID=475957 RepID=A0ABP7KFZ7_9MICO